MIASLEVRGAVRALRRSGSITAAAVLILALGLGAAAAMYAVVDQVLLRPLPVRDQSRLVVAWGSFEASGFGHVPLSYWDMNAVRGRTRVFERVAGVDYNGAWSVIGRAGGEAVPLRLGVVTGDLFGTLGVIPVAGRVLEAADDRVGAAPVAVISEGLWRRRFGADREVLGKPLPIWTTVYTVVGVVPGDFGLPDGAEAWVTVGAIRPDALTNREYGTLDLVGRLRPGQRIEDAKAELDRLLLENKTPALAADYRLRAVTRSLSDVAVGRVRPALLVLLSAAALVFVAAVLNLGGLLAVRALERQEEFALRRALGASRAALLRQITIEAAILVGLGVLAGIGLAGVALRLIPAAAPPDLPRIGTLELHAGVVLAGAGLGLLAVLVAGLLPAWSITGRHPTWPRGRVADAGARPERALGRSVAVAVQAALAIVTVATALLLTRTLAKLERLDPGFEVPGLSLLQVAFLSPAISSDEKAIAAMTEVLARVRALPGVTEAAVVLQPPLSGTGGFDYGFVAEGQTESQATANPFLNFEAITPAYFRTVGLPILRGRSFNDGDRAESGFVVIVSRSLAARMWPGEDPVGKRIKWAADTTPDGAWRTVVGVAEDARYRDFLELRPSVYVPLGQQDWIPTFMLLRSDLPLGALVPAVRREVRGVDSELDVANASSMGALLARPLAQPRFTAGVVLGFGAAAVLLAAIGLYGLVSFVVARRTREVGIRLALGARPGQIVRLVLERGMAPVAIGCALGLAIVLVGGRLLASVLYGVTARDPVSIGAAIAGFAAVAGIAALLPALRAARSDPASALRAE